MKVPVFSERLAEYAKQGGPTDERDHRSVKRLLKDLEVRILFADPAYSHPTSCYRTYAVDTDWNLSLDAALTRAYRFDRHIHVPLPDVCRCRGILEYYLKNKPMDNDGGYRQTGPSDTHIQRRRTIYLVNEAALNAAKGEEAVITSELPGIRNFE